MSITNVKAQWWKPQHHIHDTVRYVVMYEMKSIEDTTHLDHYRTDEYILLMGKRNNISLFLGYSSYKRDMELKKAGDSGLTDELIKTGQIGQIFTGIKSSSIQFDIFKRYDKKIIKTIDHIFLQGKYEYEESFDSFHWQITSETDTIHNYVCQKATCDFGGRTWEAWFTSELPFSDGPYKFCGLPGLILNIADTQDHYSWKFLSIETPSEPMMVYEVVEDKVQTTKVDFFKLQDRNKISHSISDMSSDNNAVKKAIEYEHSKNNPIELIRN